MELRYKINSRILLLALVGIIMVSSSYLMFVYDPLQMVVKKFLTFSQGSILFNLWSNPPYDVIMKLYIFNVTNPEEFLRGDEKLRVQEIGPYVYKELLTNENATFHENGTVTFNPKRVAVFDLSRSIGDPTIQRIIVPNLPLIGLQASFRQDFWKSVGFTAASGALGVTPFLNLTIDEYLWGYDDTMVQVANSFIPSWIDFGKFGILERLLSRDNNNTVTIAVDTTKHVSTNNLLTDEEKLTPYHIIDWNGSPGLKEWGYQKPENNETDTENTRAMVVEGDFEGTLFPPGLTPNTSITIFRKAFCRPVPMKLHSEVYNRDGFKAYRYKMADDLFDTPEENPDNAIYCHKGECPLKGLGNIAPCYYDIPIVLSHPHFLRADPILLEQVDGLNPNISVHQGLAEIHPDIGVPIGGNMKIQINLDVGQTKMNSKTKPFNDLVLPLFWVELTMGELPSVVYTLLTLSCHVGPIVQKIVMYLLGLIGVSLISGTALIILFFSRPTINGRISLQSEYSPIPIIHIPAQYFKPEIRIMK